MNKRAIVVATALLAIVGFALAGYIYSRSTAVDNYAAAPAADSRKNEAQPASIPPARDRNNNLVRQSSPVMGPADARVTIVEFFDPACESCRAFYPFVKQIMTEHGNAVRLVLRYAPLHEGSEEAVRILEAARRQDKFQPVLEALLDAQPIWASHGNPDIAKAWAAARNAGLDEERARREMRLPGIDAIIRQDVADLKELRVRGTPTFYVNGKPLPSFGREQLEDLVRREVSASK